MIGCTQTEIMEFHMSRGELRVSTWEEPERTLSGRDCEKNTCSPNGIQLPYTLTARKKY
jgi:hypothetical protein